MKNVLAIAALSAAAYTAPASAQVNDNPDLIGKNWWDFATVVNSYEPWRWGPNILAHVNTNSIDPFGHTNTISGGGYAGMAQIIGDSSDSTYIQGSARIATIGGGYDNVNNQLAGTVAGGAHHYLYGSGDHGTVGGGSYNMLSDGSYATIAGGTRNTVAAGVSAIGGGHSNTISGNGAYGTIGGGYQNSVSGNSSVVAGGRGNEVYAANSFAVGRDNVIEASAYASAAIGQNVTLSGGGRIGVSANGQIGQSMVASYVGTSWNDTAVTLRSSGNSTSAPVPTGKVWSGTINLTGAGSNGEVVAIKITFAATPTRIAGTPEVVTIVNELGAPTPTLSIVNGRLMIGVGGAINNTVNWNAAVVISEATSF